MTSLLLLLLLILWIFPSAIAYILLLFFKTHFVVEYAELLGFGKFMGAEQFRQWEQSNEGYGYPVFLREGYNCFLTRLLGCPWCLSFWLSLPAGILIGLSSGAAILGAASVFSIGFTSMMLYCLGNKAYQSL